MKKIWISIPDAAKILARPWRGVHVMVNAGVIRWTFDRAREEVMVVEQDVKAVAGILALQGIDE